MAAHSLLDHVLRHLGRQQAALAGVAPEDVGESRRDDHGEPVVLQRPDGVLARRARAEVGTGDARSRPCTPAGSARTRVLAPGGEQAVLEPVTRDPLEVLGRDDLVGVDVAAAQRDGGAGVDDELLHVVIRSVSGDGGQVGGGAGGR